MLMTKYTIHYILNSQSKDKTYEASSSELAYMKLMSEQPYAYVTKIINESTNTECAIPSTKKKQKKNEETNNAPQGHTPTTNLSQESIDKLSNKIASSTPKATPQSSCRDLTELSIIDWASIIFKINIATVIVMAIPIGAFIILANS